MSEFRAFLRRAKALTDKWPSWKRETVTSWSFVDGKPVTKEAKEAQKQMGKAFRKMDEAFDEMDKAFEIMRSTPTDSTDRE